jgi:signal transduction histidine kinase
MAGRFREEFVAAVRHELKTPLNAILGFADLLLQEVDGPLTAQQHEDVDAIRSAGIYLRELVEAVLAEWRPRRDTPLPMSIIDVRKLLEHVARILEGQARGRPVELRVELPEPVRGPLADERRLAQVLINLGTNALRATAQGQVTFSASDEGEYINLSVRDTGEGIDPAALATIFQRFERGSDRTDGSGLGLTIAREMVEWHGGYIEIETKRGEGTVFSVMIPKELR